MSHPRNLARLARTGIPTVDTAQKLRELVIYGNDYPSAVKTLGCLTVTDGGGGIWRWDAGNTTDADNLGTVLAPSSNPTAGRWIRDSSGNSVEAVWFGVVGDGVTDCTAALLAAIASLGSNATSNAGGNILLPRGQILLSDTIEVVRQGVMLIGCGISATDTEHGTIITNTVGLAGKPIFRFLDSPWCGLSNMVIRGDATIIPECAVEFVSEIATETLRGNSHMRIERVMIGVTRSVSGTEVEYNFNYGIKFTGDAQQNDQFHFNQVEIVGCNEDCINIPTIQSIWGTMNDVFLQHCKRGIYTRSDFTAYNLTLNACSDVGIQAYTGAIYVYGLFAEYQEQIIKTQTSPVYIFGGSVITIATTATSWAECTLANGQCFVMIGLEVIANGISQTLSVTRSSGVGIQSQVYLAGNNFPNGDSDAGYIFKSLLSTWNSTTKLCVTIDHGQGGYFRRQLIQGDNPAGIVELNLLGSKSGAGVQPAGLNPGDAWIDTNDQTVKIAT